MANLINRALHNRQRSKQGEPDCPWPWASGLCDSPHWILLPLSLCVRERTDTWPA